MRAYSATVSAQIIYEQAISPRVPHIKQNVPKFLLSGKERKKKVAYLVNA